MGKRNTYFYPGDRVVHEGAVRTVERVSHPHLYLVDNGSRTRIAKVSECRKAAPYEVWEPQNVRRVRCTWRRGEMSVMTGTRLANVRRIFAAWKGEGAHTCDGRKGWTKGDAREFEVIYADGTVEAVDALRLDILAGCDPHAEAAA